MNPNASQNILYTREREDQNYVQVDTKIVSDHRPPVTINYKLHNIDKQWKVYDLVIEDIRVVNNYRSPSQFDRVIARSSFRRARSYDERKATIRFGYKLWHNACAYFSFDNPYREPRTAAAAANPYGCPIYPQCNRSSGTGEYRLCCFGR